MLYLSKGWGEIWIRKSSKNGIGYTYYIKIPAYTPGIMTITLGQMFLVTFRIIFWDVDIYDDRCFKQKIVILTYLSRFRWTQIWW
jgi:hypothetical protein